MVELFEVKVLAVICSNWYLLETYAVCLIQNLIKMEFPSELLNIVDKYLGKKVKLL